MAPVVNTIMDASIARDSGLFATATRPPLLLLAALSLADALVSASLLHAGVMVEANPLMALALRHLGLGGCMALKLGVTALAILAARRAPAPAPRLAQLLWGLATAYLLLWLACLLAGLR